MTDRYSGYVVTMDTDVRSDDAQATIDAIKQIKGVVTVEPQIHAAPEMIAESRVRNELGRELMKILYPGRFKDD